MAILQPGIFYGDNSISPVSGAAVIGGRNPVIPATLLDKLKPQNSAGLGSVSVQGYVLNTQDAARSLLDVANAYMTNKLTADDLALILRNRDKFTFTVGVGDRRATFKGRFALATNWHGEDAVNLLLRPNPPGVPEYGFTLTFSGASGTIKVTDSHVGTHNTYGAIRYFTIRGLS
ncbi:hypothetical protein G8935_001568 [Salmonella enterica]|nr:hypothetical protein [Salmonella enterica]EEP9970213.1 hypothetical protein [Salmonella enterica]